MYWAVLLLCYCYEGAGSKPRTRSLKGDSIARWGYSAARHGLNNGSSSVAVTLLTSVLLTRVQYGIHPFLMFLCGGAREQHDVVSEEGELRMCPYG